MDTSQTLSIMANKAPDGFAPANAPSHIDIVPMDKMETGGTEAARALEQEMFDSKAANAVVDFAKTAAEKEHNMTLREGVRLYPKAIAWSMLISTCIIMEGYDVCLINNL